MHGRVEAGSHVDSSKRANRICPQYRPPHPQLKHYQGMSVSLKGWPHWIFQSRLPGVPYPRLAQKLGGNEEISLKDFWRGIMREYPGRRCNN